MLQLTILKRLVKFHNILFTRYAAIKNKKSSGNYPGLSHFEKIRDWWAVTSSKVRLSGPGFDKPGASPCSELRFLRSQKDGLGKNFCGTNDVLPFPHLLRQKIKEALETAQNSFQEQTHKVTIASTLGIEDAVGRLISYQDHNVQYYIANESVQFLKNIKSTQKVL